MSDNQLIIDPVILEEIIHLLKRYEAKQKETLDKCVSNLKRLKDKWDDERSSEEMIKAVESMCKNSKLRIETIVEFYTKYYYSQLQKIKQIN